MTVARGRRGAGGLGGHGGAGLAAGAGLARRPARRRGRMTPERWRQIDDLFDAAVRLDPAEREAWLRARLRRRRRPAGRGRPPPGPGRAGGPGRVPDAPRGRRARLRIGRRAGTPATESAPRERPEPIDRRRGRVGRRHRRLHSQGGDRAAAPGRTRSPSPESVVRARLRELPMIYILIAGDRDLLEARRPRRVRT